MHLEQWINKCAEDKGLRDIREKKNFLQRLALNKGKKMTMAGTIGESEVN